MHDLIILTHWKTLWAKDLIYPSSTFSPPTKVVSIRNGLKYYNIYILKQASTCKSRVYKSHLNNQILKTLFLHSNMIPH